MQVNRFTWLFSIPKHKYFPKSGPRNVLRMLFVLDTTYAVMSAVRFDPLFR
jgi:hypothetical protein